MTTHHHPSRRGFLVAASVPMLTATMPAWAQRETEDVRSYPSRPVRIILPFGPGSASDSVMRILATVLTEQTKQPFVVENVGGAGGITGTQRVAKASPDGYTLLAAAGASITVAPFLVEKLPYDPMRELVPITTVGDSPIVVAVRSGTYATLAALIAASKAKPGVLNYGSGGNGSAAHIAAEIFKLRTSTDMIHIPFKGVGPAVPELLAGRLDALFVSYPAVRSMVEAGSLKVLAVATAKRSPLVPGAPTASEAGLDGYVLSTWNGLMAPAGTPRAILDKLNIAVNSVLRSPDIVSRLATLGMEPIPSTQEEFAARLKEEYQTMGTLIKTAKIKAD